MPSGESAGLLVEEGLEPQERIAEPLDVNEVPGESGPGCFGKRAEAVTSGRPVSQSGPDVAQERPECGHKASNERELAGVGPEVPP